MRDHRAAKIDGCPHEFDEPTGQCRQCSAHYTTLIDRYRTTALAYVADAQRERGDVQALVVRLITPP